MCKLPVCSPLVHEALKLDDAAWSALVRIGAMPDEDDDGRPFVLELRNCPCGSTLAREIRK